MSKTSEYAAEFEPHDSGSSYEFQNADLPEAAAGATTERLLHALAKLVADVQGVRPSSDYETKRKAYVALNKVLNETGGIAPRFRPSLSAGQGLGKARNWQGNLISNDHQVLDLHWLNRQCGFDRNQDRRIPPRWMGLFGEELDLEIAARFAGTAGSAPNKADILGLSRSEELQLRTIQSDATREVWKRMKEERERTCAAVRRASAAQANLRGREEKWADGWMAIKCAERAGGMSAAAWYELMTGERIPETTLSNIKRRVPALLGKP